MNNRNVFHTVLEPRSLRLRCQHGQVLARALFWVTGYQLLILSLHDGEQQRKEPLSDSYYKGTSPIHGGSTLTSSPNPNYFPKDPPPDPITLEGTVSTYEFWGNTDIQYI